MDKITYYQINAFAEGIGKGNPAGVCPLNEWIDDSIMQSIAKENNLSETAFYVKKDDLFEIRYFTPTTEVDLCGHATLAAAFAEFNIHDNPQSELTFLAKGGKLRITQNEGFINMNFPKEILKDTTITPQMNTLFNEKPIAAFKSNDDLILKFKDENSIQNLNPDLNAIKKVPARGVSVTAKGNKADFVSRFFGPQSGIDEDPVTGSIHTYLAPLWSEILGKNTLTAQQLSKRGGKLYCKVQKERVFISGKASLYQKGVIYF